MSRAAVNSTPFSLSGIVLRYDIINLKQECAYLFLQLGAVLSTVLFQTKVYLLAFDSIFVPSIYSTDYLAGANIAAFENVANAMIAQGIV